MLIGTDRMLSERFCAVTTTSSRRCDPPLSSAALSCASEFADKAPPLSATVAITMPWARGERPTALPLAYPGSGGCSFISTDLPRTYASQARFLLEALRDEYRWTHLNCQNSRPRGGACRVLVSCGSAVAILSELFARAIR